MNFINKFLGLKKKGKQKVIPVGNLKKEIEQYINTLETMGDRLSQIAQIIALKSKNSNRIPPVALEIGQLGAHLFTQAENLEKIKKKVRSDF